MLSEEEKAALPDDYYEEAKQLALNAYTHRLQELELAPHDARKWELLLKAVAAPVGRRVQRRAKPVGARVDVAAEHRIERVASAAPHARSCRLAHELVLPGAQLAQARAAAVRVRAVDAALQLRLQRRHIRVRPYGRRLRAVHKLHRTERAAELPGRAQRKLEHEVVADEHEHTEVVAGVLAQLEEDDGTLGGSHTVNSSPLE